MSQENVEIATRWYEPATGKNELLAAMPRTMALCHPEVEEEPTSCRFALRGKRVKLSGQVSPERNDFVAWIYADPMGPEHNTPQLLDLRPGAGRRARTGVRPSGSQSRGRRLTLGTRDTDHGIPPAVPRRLDA
jgi:hypothetical protein